MKARVTRFLFLSFSRKFLFLGRTTSPTKNIRHSGMDYQCFGKSLNGKDMETTISLIIEKKCKFLLLHPHIYMLNVQSFLFFVLCQKIKIIVSGSSLQYCMFSFSINSSPFPESLHRRTIIQISLSGSHLIDSLFECHPRPFLSLQSNYLLI